MLSKSPLVAIVSLSGLTGLAPTSLGGVSIVWSGSGSHSVPENTVVDGKRRITLYAAGEQARIATITATSGSEPIEWIRIRSDDVISGETTSYIVVNVLESSGTIPYIEAMVKDPNYTSTGEFWIGTVNISGTVGVAGSAEGGSVAADYISELRADGDLNASVTIGQRTVNGRSLSLAVIAGDLRGDVSAIHGAIRDISFGGDIGSSTNTVSIQARDGIRRIETDAIWADIAANANSGSGSINRLRALTGGFAGSLAAYRLEPDSSFDNMSIAGDLAADVVFSDGIRLPIQIDGDLTGSIDATELYVGATSGSITVGGSLTGSITVDSAGLDGQIVVNAANGFGYWVGSVAVGGYVLDYAQNQPDEAPYYDRLSTDLGGGAIGLVPFNLHRKDSSPKHGSTVTTGAPTSVQIHHYGPVLDADDDTSTTPPVKVYEASIQVPIGYGQHSTIPVCDTNI